MSADFRAKALMPMDMHTTTHLHAHFSRTGLSTASELSVPGGFRRDAVIRDHEEAVAAALTDGKATVMSSSTSAAGVYLFGRCLRFCVQAFMQAW